MKQQFLKGKTDTIRLTIYADNRPIVPSSGTITLYRPSGGTALQAATAVSVNATTGEMTYSLTTTHTATKDLNYKAEWSYVVSGVTYYANTLFDVVVSILHIPVTDDDLFNELDALRKQQKQVAGTASAGAAATITDTAKLLAYPNDYWTGGVVEILSGTGIGQQRDITDFVQSTGVLSVSPNWTTNPDNTSQYRVIKPYTDKITQAFEKIETMLYNKGKRHSLILESSQIKFPLIYLVTHNICLDLMEIPEDRWGTLASSYWNKFKDAYDGMAVEYDKDESGFIEGGEEEQSKISSFELRRC